jgi:hypothetical protein
VVEKSDTMNGIKKRKADSDAKRESPDEIEVMSDTEIEFNKQMNQI